MTHVLQLALDVSIGEEDMDRRMSIEGLPGALMSVTGREVETWTMAPVVEEPKNNTGVGIMPEINHTQTLPPVLEINDGNNQIWALPCKVSV